MNINELLNKANEVIAEANEETKEEVKEEVIVELIEDSSNNDERQKELLERVNNKIELIKDLEGIEINKIGVWLWIEGDIISNKDKLTEAGLKYHKVKDMFYYNPDETFKKKSKKITSKSRMTELYGIEKIK